MQRGRLPDIEPYASRFMLTSMADKWDMVLMILGTAGAFGNGILLPLFAVAFGDVLDAFGGQVQSQDFMGLVNKTALKFLYLGIGAFFSSYLEAGAWMLTASRQVNRLRARTMVAALNQDVAFFDGHDISGTLAQSLNEDCILVQNAINEKLGVFLHHMATFASGFIVGFVRGWEMALLMLGCMPVIAVIAHLTTKGTTRISDAASGAYSEANAVAQQSLAQIRTVAAYNLEDRAVAQYSKALDATKRTASLQSWMSGASLGSIQFVMLCTYAAGLFFGSYRVAVGAYTGGTVVQVMVATLMGGFSLSQAAPYLQHAANGRAGAARMFRIIGRRAAVTDPPSGGAGPRDRQLNPELTLTTFPGGTAQVFITMADDHKAAPVASDLATPPSVPPPPPCSVSGSVELRSVHFAYPSRPDVPVLCGLSLLLPAGKTLALVGGSGSGKSTVVALVERFYDPTAGSVTLDGRDLRSLPLAWLREQVGLVSQEPTLFAASIQDNIAMGRSGASAEEVEAAARAANAHDFISRLPLGYKTEVGERGVQLSGGQKQRIAIARAILKNPKVLLLDEATSALDVRSEALVQAALDRLVAGRSTLVVAHRLSTVQAADVIAVVAGGRLVEQGSHRELSGRQGGAYAALVKAQAQKQAEHERELDAEEGGVALAEVAACMWEDDGVDECPDRTSHARSSRRSPAVLLGGDRISPNLRASAALREGSFPVRQSRRASTVLQDLCTSSVVLSHQGLADPWVSMTYASSVEHAGAVVMATASAAANLGAQTKRAAEEDSHQDNKEAAEEKPYDVPFKRLLPYTKGERISLLLGCVASAAAGAQHPAFAFVIASMITNFYTLSPSELRREASFYALMFFLVALASIASLTTQQVAFGRVARAVAGRVRRQLLGAMLRQEISWFDDSAHASGKLAASLATDAAHVRGAVGDVIGMVVQNLSTLLLGYLIALAYDWRMALLVTGAFPFVTVGLLIHLRFHSGLSSSAEKLHGEAHRTAMEAFLSIRTVHAYNLQSYVARNYEASLARANRLVARQSLVAGASFAYSTFVMFALYALIVYFMGHEFYNGWVSFPDCLKSFLAILLAAMGLAQTSMSFPDLGNAKTAVQRIFPVIDRKPAIDSADPEGEQPDPQTLRGEIEFSGVRFAYPSRPSVIVLSSFELTIAAGRITALVGESGSGKSTVVSLIERFYDPLGGAVMLDGLDLRRYNLRFLRQQVGLVSQEPLLFSGTIADNLAVGSQGATQEQLEEAAETANARTFIEALPDKYLTRVGEGGAQLSGGQKQRIAIARAVLKNPKVLLLDEATSALDSRSEALVQAALDRVMQGRTSVVVAHRLSTIRGAHTIAVFHRGRVVERGSHEQLMAGQGGAGPGRYAQMVTALEGSCGAPAQTNSEQSD